MTSRAALKEVVAILEEQPKRLVGWYLDTFASEVTAIAEAVTEVPS